MSTNIGYWERVLNAPTPAYQELFNAEHAYILNNIPAGSKVLDIGCGEGRNMKSIFEVSPHVFGVDNDVGAVLDAQKNFKDFPTVKIVQGDATELPFENETFDVVTFLMILPNLDNNKVKAFQEMARVLKKSGSVMLSTFADTAFEDRMEVYKLVKVPIKKIEGTKITFDKSLGANVSEQFSLEEINGLAASAKLKITHHQKVGQIGYICTLKKF